MLFDLNTLLNVNPDLTLYEIKSGDEETSANISIAQLKELLLAINASSRRIHALLSDIKAIEQKMVSLERSQRAISNYHD